MPTHASLHPAETSLNNPRQDQIDDHHRYENLIGRVGLGHDGSCNAHHIEQRDRASQGGTLHPADDIITVGRPCPTYGDGGRDVNKSMLH